MIRSLFILLAFSFSFTQADAQYELFEWLSPSESFIASRMQQPVFDFPYGVLLGEVDSIQVVSGEIQDTTWSTFPFVYEGAQVTFTSTQGDTSIGFFYQSDFTVPRVKSQNGIDSFQHRIIVAFDLFGSLFIDTTYDSGVLEYSDGILVGTTYCHHLSRRYRV